MLQNPWAHPLHDFAFEISTVWSLFPVLILISTMSSVCLSLSSERAAASPSESAVIVNSVVECLRYCILQNTETMEDQRKIRTMLISQQVGSQSSTHVSHPVKSTSCQVSTFSTLFCCFSFCSCCLSSKSPSAIPPFRMVLSSFWSLKCWFPGRREQVYLVLVKQMTARASLKSFWLTSGRSLVFSLSVTLTMKKRIHRLWKG